MSNTPVTTIRGDEKNPSAIDLHAYHAPGSCSRVMLNALEEIGESYKETAIAFARGEHHQPDFVALNPKAKVPFLIDKGTVVTELPVILYHLASTRPSAKLLPVGSDGRPSLGALSDLTWMSGALHPAMNKMVFPQMTAPNDGEFVAKAGLDQLTFAANIIASKYQNNSWYYGDNWSITDLFVVWNYSLAESFGFPLKDYPTLVELKARCEERPAFQRVRDIEIETTERDQIPQPPGITL